MADRETFFVGVDIGTTSVKAVVYDGVGRVAGHHTVGYPLHAPAPSVAEQDPDEIFAATVAAIGGAVVAASGAARGAVAGVAFSAAMHSVIAVDASGAPLTASITWADNRSAASA
ncbi:MAG TPA: FGGY family carbohydrate kinase, partial [Rhodospirillales bacterium]|nr:FGGY family carbohydrate kinase [Rhodospirillales bacterium]